MMGIVLIDAKKEKRREIEQKNLGVDTKGYKNRYGSGTGNSTVWALGDDIDERSSEGKERACVETRRQRRRETVGKRKDKEKRTRPRKKKGKVLMTTLL